MRLFKIVGLSVLLTTALAPALSAYAADNDHKKATVIPVNPPKKTLVIGKNKLKDTYQCCGPNGCYPAPGGHPWNCGNAPIVLKCDKNGICSPQ